MAPTLEADFNLLVLFLFYGLALFTVGIAIALQWRRESSLPLTGALPALAIFAFLHGLHAWVEMLVVIRQDLLMWASADWLNLLGIFLDSAAFLFLLWFGVDIVARSRGRVLRWLALLPVLLWIGAMWWALRTGAMSPQDPVAVADDLARLLMGLPGIILASWGLFKHRNVFFDLGMPDIASSCTMAATSLLLYGILNNLIGSQMPFFPADVINYDVFNDIVGVSLLVPRTVMALVAAYFLVKILRAYQHEQDLRLLRANQECYRAQEEKLEVQRREDAQLKSWNENLERTVVARTHDLERRHLEAEALHEIATQITSLSDISLMLSTVAERSRVLLGADLASVVMVEEDQRGLCVSAVSGNRTEALVNLRLEWGHGVHGMAVASGRPVAVDDYLTNTELVHAREADASVAAEELRAHLVVPMKASGRVVGAIGVAGRGERRFGGDDLVLLSRMAVVAALGIENNHLHARSRRAAVLEERSRISREIHDGLAQAMAILATMARSTRDRVKDSGDARTIENLKAMEQTAHEAYLDARRAIRDLRLGGGPGLVSALKESLRRFGVETGVETEFVMGEAWMEAWPADISAQVGRIVNEALANVRKHADASRVRLELGAVGAYGVIIVDDDGRGFGPDRTDCCAVEGLAKSGLEGEDCHFGLRTMRERAESIGGYLRIESVPGDGARVVLGVPLPAIPFAGGEGRLAPASRAEAPQVAER